LIELAFDKIKIHQTFKIKTFNKPCIKVMYLNMIKATHDKSTASITLNSEKRQSFSSKIKNKAKSPLSPLLFIIIKKFPARVIRQTNELKIKTKDI